MRTNYSVRLLLICLISIVCIPLLAADRGKLILKNGNVFSGIIETMPDGGYRVITPDTVIVTFTKNEVKKVIYTAKQQAGQSRKTAFGKNTGNSKQNRVESAGENLDELISSAAMKHSVDPVLLKAVMRTESEFNPRNVSNKGACGLMQLMPDTAKGLGVKNIFSPYENVNAGARFLNLMIGQFNGDWELALAAYNAGPGAVKKYKNVPPYKETRDYIKKVYKNYNRYYRPEKIYTYTDETGCLNIYNVK